jgi:hypothetical protein
MAGLAKTAPELASCPFITRTETAIVAGPIGTGRPRTQGIQGENNEPTVRSASLLEQRGFEPPVLVGLSPFGKRSKSRRFRPELAASTTRRTIL